MSLVTFYSFISVQCNQIFVFINRPIIPSQYNATPPYDLKLAQLFASLCLHHMGEYSPSTDRERIVWHQDKYMNVMAEREGSN